MKAKGAWLTQTLFEAGGRVDDYIQEPVETGGFILWKNSQGSKKDSERGVIIKASRSLVCSGAESDMEGRNKTAFYSKKHVA